MYGFFFSFLYFGGILNNIINPLVLVAYKIVVSQPTSARGMTLQSNIDNNTVRKNAEHLIIPTHLNFPCVQALPRHFIIGFPTR